MEQLPALLEQATGHYVGVGVNVLTRDLRAVGPAPFDRCPVEDLTEETRAMVPVQAIWFVVGRDTNRRPG